MSINGIGSSEVVDVISMLAPSSARYPQAAVLLETWLAPPQNV